MQVSFNWKECATLPVELHGGKATVINGIVYCGGDTADLDDDDYVIYRYNPSQDSWTTLPPLPVRLFSLGEVNGKLVAVGGEEEGTGEQSNKLYTYNRQSNQWTHTIPPMPTARRNSSILSLPSALVVAGGMAADAHTSAVEIFKPLESQWYTTDPLPIPCKDMSLAATGSICYALGGYGTSVFKQALYASVDDLFHNAVPANQTTHSGSSAAQSAWKTLPDTPTYGPTAAVLADNLFAIGGKLSGCDRKEVYVYSPSVKSWIHISDLPNPLSYSTVAVVSSPEVGILVIGGYYDYEVNTVYKGTLHLKL